MFEELLGNVYFFNDIVFQAESNNKDTARLPQCNELKKTASEASLMHESLFSKPTLP